MILRRTTPGGLPIHFAISFAVKQKIVTCEFLTSICITVATQTEALATTHRGWLCEVNGKFNGFASGNLGNGELEVIAVLPDHAGNGIGSRVMDQSRIGCGAEGV